LLIKKIRFGMYLRPRRRAVRYGVIKKKNWTPYVSFSRACFRFLAYDRWFFF